MFERGLSAARADEPAIGAGRSGAGARVTPVKILSRERLLEHREELRRRGQRLVQCHGCFDIVHPGHIRHLRQAKALGDVLLVSITADQGIQKGKGRPLIPEDLRAENLAALDFVDLVFVEHRETAEELLEQVRPDVFVKGKEYENNSDPRFRAERDAVERHGGRVVFSSGDVVFSSTALIAAMENSVDPYHARLAALLRREELDGARLFSHIGAFRSQRPIIVGECIRDTYIICDRPEVAGESPILTLRPLETRNYDGGAAVIARHAAAMGARPVLVTALPENAEAEALRRRLEADGIEVRAIKVPQRIPEKQRFIVGQQKVLKLDLLEHFILDVAQQQELVDLAIESAMGAAGGEGATCGIVADFGLGLFSPRMMNVLTDGLRDRVGVLAGDVSGKRSNLRAMRRMDLLCPSEFEVRESLRMHGEGLPLVVWNLLEETGSSAALVSMGSEGLIGFDRLTPRGAGATVAAPPVSAWTTRLRSEHIPALCPLAIDPLGCGDALLTAATLTLAAGGPLIAAAFLGSCAASIQVQRLGNNAISASDLRRQLTRLHTSHLTYAGPDEIPATRPGLAKAG